MNNSIKQLEKEYKEISEETDKAYDELILLMKDPKVQEYFAKRKEYYDLFFKKEDLYKNIKIKKYDKCKHITVISRIDYDRFEGRKYVNRGCIKCGLDGSVLDMNREYIQDKDTQIMYDYLKHNYIDGERLDIICDLDLAMAICSKIKETHKKISDERLIEYFKYALYGIRNNYVNEDRKEDRAKRLSLKPGFNKWHGHDVTYY